MGIKLKKQTRNGKTVCRPFWYGAYVEDGRQKNINLNVRVAGTPPASLSLCDRGDKEFERGRAEAQRVFDELMEERRRKGNAQHLIERLIESKTGKKVVYVRLAELAGKWNDITRTNPLSEGRRRQNEFVVGEFAASCGKDRLIDVTDEDVNRYFNEIRGRLAWSSVNSRISFLTSAFGRYLPHGCPNPFKSMMKRDNSPEAAAIHKTPLTDDELRKVRAYAASDPFVLQLFECALATGARIGDVCHMKWANIDLREGFISYRTSKTGQWCEVPIFDEFRRILEGLLAVRDPDEELLFPEAARMYDSNRSGIEYRGKKLFADALFAEDWRKARPTDVVGGRLAEDLAPAEILDRIGSANFTPAKTERMKDVYTRYAIQHQNYRQIEEDTNIPRGTISGYLNEIENLCGTRVIRVERDRPCARNRFRHTREVRAGGRRSVSKYGWHSLRATFCVQAKLHGVPESEIIKAVGHTTYRTTAAFYDNPTREMTRALWKDKMSSSAIGTAMPAASPATAMANFISSLTPEQRNLLTLELLRQSV